MGRIAPQGTRPKSRAASLATLLAVALLALAAVDLVLSAITPPSADIAAPRRAQADTGLDADLSILTRRNIFEGAPEATLSVVPQDDLPVTTLQLKLKGSVPSEDGASRAIIELPSGTQELFAEGETIMRGVELSRIELYRVVISRNGVAEALLLENRPERQSDIPISQGIPVEAQGDADPETLQLDALEAAVANSATLGDLAGPAFRIFEASGAEAGDIPVAVNGDEITDVRANWADLVAAAREDGSLVLTVKRGDEFETLVIELPNGINF